LTTHGGSTSKANAAETVRYRLAAEFLKGVDVLDVGCGYGHGSYFFAKQGAKSVLGIDSDSKAIRYANRKYRRDNLRFELMDATRIALPPQSFKAAVSLEVIEHLTNSQHTRTAWNTCSINSQ
jgi:2-polyprenyl-3-methyl-5-hydroxy-6-metoxy-1,4-benzoquinol methylase